MKKQYSPDSQAVTAHLSILQDIIRRMGSNSSSCKIQCVVLVTGILVAVGVKGTLNHAWLALIPISLFLFLDANYLALERDFRHSYNAFVCKLHITGTVPLCDLYAISPSSRVNKQLLVSLRSKAIWPFYGALFVTTLLVWQFDCIQAPVDCLNEVFGF